MRIPWGNGVVGREKKTTREHPGREGCAPVGCKWWSAPVACLAVLQYPHMSLTTGCKCRQAAEQYGLSQCAISVTELSNMFV